MDNTKHEFYMSESITGKIIIYNNNSFKIDLNNQLFQMLTGCNFNVFSIDENKEYGAVYNYLQSLEVESKGSLIIYFEFDRFIIFPLETKQINYMNMNVGNYSMYSYFYYGDSFDDMRDPHHIIGHYCKGCGEKLEIKAKGITNEQD